MDVGCLILIIYSFVIVAWVFEKLFSKEKK